MIRMTYEKKRVNEREVEKVAEGKKFALQLFLPATSGNCSHRSETLT